MKLTNLRFVIWLAVGTLLSACSGGGGGGAPTANSPPTSVIIVNKTSDYAPLSLVFDASQSSDRDGSITGYSWDFGDGTNSLGSQASHTYTNLGQFAVTLTVTDNDGATSSTQLTIDVHAQAAGFYLGRFFSNVTGIDTDVEVHIGTNHQLYGVGFGICFSFYSGDLSIVGSSATSSLLVESLDAACIFPDGSSIGNVDAAVTIEARSTITGTYVGVGDGGTIQIDYIPEVSERPSSLSEIAGVWSWSDGFGYTETMVIEDTGDFTDMDTDGCVLIGKFSLIDPSLNEFEIGYDLTCPPGINEAGDGRRLGLAFVDDFFFVDDWLIWDITFQEGPLAGRQGGGSVARPAASALTTNGDQMKGAMPELKTRAFKRNQ